jgi:hypothetical protein
MDYFYSDLIQNMISYLSDDELRSYTMAHPSMSNQLWKMRYEKFFGEGPPSKNYFGAYLKVQRENVVKKMQELLQQTNSVAWRDNIENRYNIMYNFFQWLYQPQYKTVVLRTDQPKLKKALQIIVEKVIKGGDVEQMERFKPLFLEMFPDMFPSEEVYDLLTGIVESEPDYLSEGEVEQEVGSEGYDSEEEQGEEEGYLSSEGEYSEEEFD